VASKRENRKTCRRLHFLAMTGEFEKPSEAPSDRPPENPGEGDAEHMKEAAAQKRLSPNLVAKAEREARRRNYKKVAQDPDALHREFNEQHKNDEVVDLPAHKRHQNALDTHRHLRELAQNIRQSHTPGDPELATGEGLDTTV